MFHSLNLFSTLGWKVGSWWPGVVLAILGRYITFKRGFMTTHQVFHSLSHDSISRLRNIDDDDNHDNHDRTDNNNSVLNNIGTNVMKLAINKRQLLPPEERPRLTRLPMWTSGFAMFILGTAMSFGAFRFAAQSLLSGLASVQFLSQVVFSRFVLHEKIEKYAYVGVTLIITGCVFIVVFGAHGTKNYRPEELAALYGRSEYVCYLLGAGFTACVVSILYTSMKQRIVRDRSIGRFDIAHATIRERQILAFFFSIKSALFGTQAVVLAKSLSMLLIQALHPNPAYSNPLLSYQTYFIILGFISAATFWVTRLNHGLRLFEAVYLVPMMQICWILFSTIAGGIYYEEFIEFGRKEYGAYAIGFLCVLSGVALLCHRGDAKSMNAADVIYEIVSDENPLLGSPSNEDKFQAFDDDEENRLEQGLHVKQEKTTHENGRNDVNQPNGADAREEEDESRKGKQAPLQASRDIASRDVVSGEQSNGV